jgi:hypothetical protein
MTNRNPTLGPLSHREHATVSEVLALYDLTPAQEKTAREAIERRWHETSGRFHAYTVAHQTAAAISLDKAPDVSAEPGDEILDSGPSRGR